MPRILIDRDELWPVYGWQLTWGEGAELCYPMPDIDEATLDRWREAELAWRAYQQELETVARQYHPTGEWFR